MTVIHIDSVKMSVVYTETLPFMTVSKDSLEASAMNMVEHNGQACISTCNLEDALEKNNMGFCSL
jgi:hypothetical protein